MKPLVSQNYETDNSDRTSFVKDRLMPNIQSKGNALIGATGGALVGAGLGLAGKKAVRAGYKKALSSDFSKQLGKALGESFQGNHELYANLKKFKSATKKPAKLIFGPEMAKTRALAAAGAGAITFGAKGKEVGRVVGDVSNLKKQYVAQFGVEPTESELLDVAKLDPKNKTHRKMMNYFYTPNAMTKSTTRSIRQMYDGPESIGKNTDNVNTLVGPFYQSSYSGMYKSKFAHVDNDSLEKVAEIKDKIHDIATSMGKIHDSAVRFGRGAEKGLKTVPYITGAVGGATAAVPSYFFANSLVADDDKHRGKKIAAMTLAGTGAGSVLGGAIGKDTADVITGVSKKISHPLKTGLDGANKYKDMIRSFVG